MVASTRSPYRLIGFVPRAVLIPRATAAITKTFPDGTAVAISVEARGPRPEAH